MQNVLMKHYKIAEQFVYINLLDIRIFHINGKGMDFH